MDPIRLQIENFCRHSKSDISFLDFPSALILGKVKGNDRLSNGVGKSTIFAAIKYVLFNEVDASTLDQVIRHGTDYCRVSFEFISSLDGQVYRITRTKSKKAGSEVLLHRKANEVWVNLTGRRNPDTEKEIAKVIKINYKTFCNSTLFGQSDLNGLATLTPEKRKLALKDALQLNVYSKYESLAKKKAADLLKEIDKEKIVLNTIGDPNKDILGFGKELDVINDLMLTKTKLLTIANNSYDKEHTSYTALNKMFEAHERAALDSINKQKLLQDEIIKLSNITSDYNRKILSVSGAGKSLSAESKELAIHLEKLVASKSRSKELVKNEIETLSYELVNKRVSLNSKLAKLDELRVPLPTGSTCGQCRQKVSFASQEERDACQKSIDDDMRILSISIKTEKNEISKHEEMSLRLKEELKTIEAIEGKVITIRASIESKSKEIELKRGLYTEYFELFSGNEKLLADKNQELIELKNDRSNASEYYELKSSIKNANAKLVLLSREINDINSNIVAFTNNKAVLAHKIEERIKDADKIKTALASISKLEERYIVHQKVIQAFGSGGIPALITHTILDDFQSETNLWLAKLRPGLQSQFSVIKDRGDGDQEDTLTIDYMLDGHDIEYALLSGAQKFIVALGLKLGLASVIKKRLGVEVRLLLIDEVDQCLDQGSLEAFEAAIRQLQQDFKVLVITHNNELKAKFNHAILVEQNENFVSEARVVNTW